MEFVGTIEERANENNEHFMVLAIRNGD